MILILVGLTMGLISATYNLTAGEPYNLTLEEEFEYYSIVGNSTPVNLSVISNGLVVTIIPDKYLKSTSFELIFFNNDTEIVHEYHSGDCDDDCDDEIKIVYKDREVIVNVTDETPRPEENITIGIGGETEEGPLVPAWLVYTILGAIIFLVLIYLLTNHFTKEKGEEIDS